MTGTELSEGRYEMDNEDIPIPVQEEEEVLQVIAIPVG